MTKASWSCLHSYDLMHRGCGATPTTCSCICHLEATVTESKKYTLGPDIDLTKEDIRLRDGSRLTDARAAEIAEETLAQVRSSGEFPDRNLDILRDRVASGRTRLDGTRTYLTPDEVAALPVGTLLEDGVASAAYYLWVRVEGDELYCIYVEEGGESIVRGLGTVIPSDSHTSLNAIGSLPATPAARNRLG